MICRPCVCVLTFSNIFSSETTGPIEAKFHVEPPSDGGMKVSSNGPGHVTKMAAMPIYGKTLQNLLWNQKAYDFETWNIASDARVLPNLFKWWPWPIFGEGQIWSFMFLYGKKVKQWIFQKLLQSMISKLIDAVN